MRAELKSLTSPDFDLESCVPANPGSFCFVLEAVIGLEEQEGGEIFLFEVCTPRWLETAVAGAEPIFGMNKLIVPEYNYAQLRDFLVTYCGRCVSDSWPKIARKLASVGAWEFEDYEEHASD